VEVLTDDKWSLSLYDHFDRYNSGGVKQHESCNIPKCRSPKINKDCSSQPLINLRSLIFLKPLDGSGSSSQREIKSQSSDLLVEII
jgi:hypothetical protein